MHRIFCILAGALLFFNSATAKEVKPTPSSEVELRLALRDLWTGHVFWVRAVVMSSKYRDSEATQTAEARVVANARALADGVGPFYGQEAADELFDLLAGHYGAIKGYLDASTANSRQGKTSSTEALTENARAIATFLDAANPNLPQDVVLPLLLAHGGHHIRQIDLVKEDDFEAEAKIWEEMTAHVHAIADAMAGALAKQFPGKVSG